MTPLPLLMGVETEYAVVGRSARAGPGGADALTAEHLLAVARERLTGLPERSGSGLYLGNGGRLYLDTGSHPEFATPECSDPWEVIRYVRAGERILGDLARAAVRHSRNFDSIDVFRSNVDYATPRTSWGCHESYLHRTDPRSLPPMLIPHLASRIVYTGAGGFNPFSRGLRFTLSPRAWMIEHPISEASTHDRGIYHTRTEPLSGCGYHRLHIICGESLCSDLGLLLRLGATGLIVAAIDAGWTMGTEIELQSPVGAMHAIAADPECKRRVRLTDGRKPTAIELQRHYLERVEACGAAGALPDWAPEVCRLWRETLDSLARDPTVLRNRLDWGMKQALFERWVRDSAGHRDLEPWTRIGDRHRARILGHTGTTDTVTRIRAALPCLGPEQAGRFRALRQELFEIDVRFGQLGERGVFTQLDRGGLLRARLVETPEIERAMTEPPSRGRARTRGEWIQQVCRAGATRDFTCDWTKLWNRADGTTMDLSDPFAERYAWSPMAEAAPGGETPLPDIIGPEVQQDLFYPPNCSLRQYW